ncbi:MAG: hypothetical protein J3K34DRAFT_435330 [Monoraphidium minutum]|nr:MAG: hypothetical protein J3K34DRAFT_435330 [Monoraphidium minutum]
MSKARLRPESAARAHVPRGQGAGAGPPGPRRRRAAGGSWGRSQEGGESMSKGGCGASGVIRFASRAVENPGICWQSWAGRKGGGSGAAHQWLGQEEGTRQGCPRPPAGGVPGGRVSRGGDGERQRASRGRAGAARRAAAAMAVCWLRAVGSGAEGRVEGENRPD